MMDEEQRGVYPPLNTLKPVATDVWIVDGPIIRFGMPWPKAPFPTRMTIVRLGGRRLFIHSPTLLTAQLKAETEAIGEVAWIVAPNRLHYSWAPDWREAFPNAEVYLAPRIREQAGARINFPVLPLDREAGFPWDDAISTLPVRGDFLTEIVFFHHPSRTLILTDLIENFEPQRLNWFMRWLTRVGGAQDPDGQTPRDMRLTFAKHRSEFRAAVDRMIGWDPQRVILAHGRWYDNGAADELRRAFRWALH